MAIEPSNNIRNALSDRHFLPNGVANLAAFDGHGVCGQKLAGIHSGILWRSEQDDSDT